uniref:AcetylCoA_hyd_C domain-containing protein n=1 Tax=Rhabditophanes sp. KR3021 TaxID=114890 RepID=A0AC35UHU8_9BILA
MDSPFNVSFVSVSPPDAHESWNPNRNVPVIREGSGVATKYVVAECGIADLFGKNIRQRVFELIQITHPDDRKHLEKSALEKLKAMPSKD